MPAVTVIKATRDVNTSAPLFENKKKRVAAYARVSTDQDEQFTSFESQIHYYEELIKSNPDYEYVNVYSDEGLSGTSVKKRKGFNLMIKDAKEGKIDLILVKSISRFGRNLLDIIGYIQELKKYGVEVHFDKENLKTFDKNVDVTLAIMSAIAQEESHSISGNVKAGIRYKYARGEYGMPYGSFLGFKKGEDGKPELVPEEADLVKKIYSYFIRDKLTINQIATKLNKEGYLTKKGNKWLYHSVLSILKNEKYKGDALLQKGYVKNYLDHVVVKNNGELDQYYVEKGHAQIISDDDWALTQVELQIREQKQKPFVENDDIFAGKIICGDCGASYGRKLWHSNDKYRCFIYQCNHKFLKGKDKCTTPSLKEADIKRAFLEAYNELIDQKDEILELINAVNYAQFDDEPIKEKMSLLSDELHDQNELINSLITANNKKPMEQEVFLRKYSRYKEKAASLKAEIEELRREAQIMHGKFVLFSKRIEELKNANKISNFEDLLFTTFIDKVVAYNDLSLEFNFVTGQAIRIKI